MWCESRIVEFIWIRWAQFINFICALLSSVGVLAYGTIVSWNWNFDKAVELEFWQSSARQQHFTSHKFVMGIQLSRIYCYIGEQRKQLSFFCIAKANISHARVSIQKLIKTLHMHFGPSYFCTRCYWIRRMGTLLGPVCFYLAVLPGRYNACWRKTGLLW